MPNTRTTQIGANVRAEMSRRGVQQTTMAAHLGISQTQVSQRLRGAIPFRVDELFAVAEFLGVSFSALLPDAAVANSVATAV